MYVYSSGDCNARNESEEPSEGGEARSRLPGDATRPSVGDWSFNEDGGGGMQRTSVYV